MTSRDVENGTSKFPSKTLNQTSAWIEHEVHELTGRSSSVSSSDEHNNKKQRYSEETFVNQTNAVKVSTKEYPQVLISSGSHQRKSNHRQSSAEQKAEVRGNGDDSQVHRSIFIQESSDTEQEVLSPISTKQQHVLSSRAALKVKRPVAESQKGIEDVGSDTLSSRSRRVSGGDSSLDGSRSATSQSDARSYRDKLKDRVHNMKERAGIIATEVKSHHQLRQYIARQAGRISRAAELLHKEELEVEAALEKHAASRNRDKPSSINESRVDEPETEKDAAYDFFTRTEPQPVVGSPSTVLQSDGDNRSPTSSGDVVPEEELIEGAEGDKSKLLAADYLGFSRDEWEVVDHTVGPRMISSSESDAKGSELLFWPRSSLIPLEERIGSEREARYREDEGLYVGKRPKTRTKNYLRLVNRLYAPDGTRWFGDDGELITLPDPIRSSAHRPPTLRAEEVPYLQLEYVPAMLDTLPSLSVGMDGANYSLLEVHIGNLQFQHHPLFSYEHVLAQRLSDLYQQYRHRAAINCEERLAGRLDSLRQAYENLRQSLDTNSADAPSQRLDRMQRYKEEIRSTRQELLSQGMRSRQLLVSLLSCWRDLKKYRATQGYVSTPHKLVIHRERLSQDEMVSEKVKWEADIRLASSEVETELQEEYSQHWERYQEELKAWKDYQAKLKSRPRVKEKRPSDCEEEEGDEDETNSDKISQSVALEGETVLLEEPVEPEPVDMGAVRSQVLDRMKQCLRPPGEPRLNLSLSENEVVDDEMKDSAEKQRRSAVKRCRLYVKVFYNNKEVCKTHAQTLSSRFKIAFNECFAIRIMQAPESLQVALYEEGAGGGRHHLTHIYLPIPSGYKTIKSAIQEQHEFSCDRVVTYSHAGVGSGTFISGSPGINRCLYTSGTLSARVGWGLDSNTSQILAPHGKYLRDDDSEHQVSDLVAQLGQEGFLNVEKLSEWAQKAQLDPNDPANASFYFFLKNASGAYAKEPDYFRLNPLQSDFDFCQMSDLESNLRLRLLHLRDQGEAEFRDWKFVPIREREIPADVFMAYEKRVSASARETELDLDLVWSDPMSSHRAWGRLYLDRVYQRVLAQCKQAQRTANLQHVVVEDQVPDISTLGLTFMKWLQPKRPLRPMRKERKKVAVQSLAGQDVRLMVNVIRAFEVPVRKNMDMLTGSTVAPPPTNLGFTPVPVRPFVEVSFQGTTHRTTTAEGANPTWNQDMQIPVRSGSSESDTLFIHLFDEVLVDLVEDDRLRETSIHQRLERHWLASLQIPFTTLVHNSRIEGTFKMYSPPVLLGYERESHQRSGWQSGTFSLDQGGQLFPYRDATFINLFITVQPALNAPEPFNERLDSSEVSLLEEHLIRFEREVETTVPHRRIKTLVIDVSGKTVCITRFFRPLTPPVFHEGETTTDEMAARFVSMVPTTQSQAMFDIWLSCDQVLRLGWGDSWAHAVLLCCYFLGLGRQAWLLVGTGIPHGQTAYVLVREKQERAKYHYWVWDPLAGQRYSIYDSFCPLQHIYALINDENIWVNQQKEELPRRTQLELSRRSDWLAALGRRGAVAAPVGSVQPAALHYTPTSASAVSALQDKLEKFLRDSIMKWRRTQTTHWNRYCIATLRKVLPRLELASTAQGGESASPHHTRELQHILSAHKMCGFPINMPFTTPEAVVEAVRATGVHQNQDEDAELALAVYIHPFPNNILSVWVYIASLTKLR